jgi:hypothetical protein
VIKWDIEGALLLAEIGDSFFVPTLNHFSVRSSIYSTARKLGMAVIVKPTMQDGVLGLRTWRVLPEQVVDSDSEAT